MSGAKRALLVLPTGLRGGAEGVAFTLAASLAKAGWYVDILVMSRGPQLATTELATLQGVAVHAQGFSSEKTSLLATVARIIWMATRKDYALVYSTHLHVNAMLGLLRLLGLLKCERLVARESTMILDRFVGGRLALFRAMYIVGYRAQDLIVAQTKEMARSLGLVVPKNRRRLISVVPNPIMLPPFRKLEPGLAVNSKRRIVACGRLVPVKGFSALIEAFATFAFRRPDWDLQIVGSGDLFDELRETSGRLGVGDRVHLLGFHAAPWMLMRGADLGVVSSVREGFPNVILEMMACGVKRIVSTPCTEGVLEIPDINVSTSTKANDLALAIEEVIEEGGDRSLSYKEYIAATHAPEHFVAAILGLLDVDR